MKFLNKPSFVSLFLFVFSVTLLVLGCTQAFFGSLRWYNGSEQKHENLQTYPTYSATEESKPGTIRVRIAQKPASDSNAFVFLHTTSARREEALSTVTPQKAQNITQRLEIITQFPSVYETVMPEIFQSPVQISVKPTKSGMPRGYPFTMNAILTGTYFREVLWKFPLIVDNDRVSPRGQMTNESVILSGRIKSASEMSKVLIHELGHMVDIYFIKQRGRNSDPSQLYYAISWAEPTVMLPGMTAKSFASGYASSNQYEDFAEAFTLYIFHNTTFATRAKEIPAMQQKYDFLKNQVFGEYFIGTNFEQNPLPTSLWDVTKIAIKSETLSEIFTYLGLSLRPLL